MRVVFFLVDDSIFFSSWWFFFLVVANGVEIGAELLNYGAIIAQGAHFFLFWLVANEVGIGK